MIPRQHIHDQLNQSETLMTLDMGLGFVQDPKWAFDGTRIELVQVSLIRWNLGLQVVLLITHLWHSRVSSGHCAIKPKPNPHSPNDLMMVMACWIEMIHRQHIHDQFNQSKTTLTLDMGLGSSLLSSPTVSFCFSSSSVRSSIQNLTYKI
ncbi:hypothetical protein AVEN_142823-1 [Araneus ventricosus]|uniref:Uncharacterized protein n=1 Tax=Araneus ventricosus TaxID=182803 RepID=A0A4Y2XBT6_ARAVE|nr:hypothetical protein AVEN_142823-1 [Araneus ventricosus]